MEANSVWWMLLPFVCFHSIAFLVGLEFLIKSSGGEWKITEGEYKTKNQRSMFFSELMHYLITSRGLGLNSAKVKSEIS